jgi:hypothetical protein
MTRLGELSFISTVSVFGTPADVTLSEIALECTSMNVMMQSLLRTPDAPLEW